MIRGRDKYEPPCRSIFVTGVPADASKIAVTRYFSYFGKIRYVQLQLLGSKRRAYVVQPADLKTFRAILDPNLAHYFQGRYLQCSPYESGSTLIRHNIEMNKRRVIIKRVPSIVELKNLKNWLETRAGSVQSMFAYSTEDSKKRLSNIQRKYKSYSVVFNEATAARDAVAIQKHTFLEGFEPSTFERFRPNRSRDYTKNNTSTEALEKPYPELENNYFNTLQTQHKNNAIQRRIMEHGLLFTKPLSKQYFEERRTIQSINHDGSNLQLNLLKPGSPKRHVSSLDSLLNP